MTTEDPTTTTVGHNATYGRDVRELLDLLTPPWLDQPAVTDHLVEAAGGGAVLELGVGNGRLAVPLAAAGVAVHGVDLSPEMLEDLHARDATGTITSTRADLLDVSLDRSFAVVLCAGNTLGQMRDQPAQVRAVRTMADHVTDDGLVIIEAHDPTRLHAHPDTQTVTLPVGRRLLHQTTSVDPVHQVVAIARMLVDPVGGGCETSYEHGRYVWPGELDLMAQMAGLVPAGRYRDWTRAPYEPGLTRFVATYRRAVVEPDATARTGGGRR